MWTKPKLCIPAILFDYLYLMSLYYQADVEKLKFHMFLIPNPSNRWLSNEDYLSILKLIKSKTVYDWISKSVPLPFVCRAELATLGDFDWDVEP